MLCAQHLISNEPFAVILADDLIANDGPLCLKQMVDVYQETQAGVLAVQTVKPSETEQYGIVEIDGEHTVRSIVEKPHPDNAPSNLAVVGRYILPSEIFACLEQTAAGAGGEIQLTDAIANLIKKHRVVTHLFHGKRYDCGSKLGYLKANVEYGLKHKAVGDRFRQYLQGLVV